MFLLKILKKDNCFFLQKFKNLYFKNIIHKISKINEKINDKFLRTLLIINLLEKNKLIKKFYNFKYNNNYFNQNFIKNLSHIKLNFEQNSFKEKQNFIVYIFNIYLTNTNTFMNITDLKGNSKLYCSSGCLNLKGKQKKRQPIALINILKFLIPKMKFFKNLPIAIHFKNLNNYLEHYVLKILKNKFFIKIIKSYSLQPHNGCKLKKLKRYKHKKKRYF